MKNFTLTFALIIFAITISFSQEKKYGVELSEIRKNKHHLELDIKNVFYGLGGASILYKRKYQTGKQIAVNSIKLIRFMGAFENQFTITPDPNRDTDNNQSSVIHPSNSIDIQLGIGFEKQTMNKDFVHYYGVDGIVNYTRADDDYSNGKIGGVTNNYVSTTDRLIRVLRTGVNPFFVIKYYFNSSISIGLETGIEVAYFNQKITEVESFYNVINILEFNELEPVTSHGIQALFNNIRFVTVGYTFK